MSHIYAIVDSILHIDKGQNCLVILTVSLNVYVVNSILTDISMFNRAMEQFLKRNVRIHSHGVHLNRAFQKPVKECTFVLNW